MRSSLSLRPGRIRFRTVLALAVLALGAGCQSSHPREGRRLDRSVITRDEMLAGKYTTAYDAVAALRSIWLRPRGPDSFVLPSVVWVYVDAVRAGGVEVLHNVQPRLVNTLRFYDGPSATSRWGVDNGAGVIHVSTWSEGALGIPLPDSTRRTSTPAPN